MSQATIKEKGDTVIYAVALNEHPLVAGEDDDRSDEELIAEVRDRTAVTEPLEWPGWAVFESDPPDDETLRYVNTASRINVKALFEEGIWDAHKKCRDVFDAIAELVEIDGFGIDNASMSHYGAVHIDDFDGEVHLDATGEEREAEVA